MPTLDTLDRAPPAHAGAALSRDAAAHMVSGALRAQAEQACRLMKVLSHPDRLMLLCQLAQGEQRVGELEDRLGITQPTLSQQLAVLRDEALVRTRREGKHIHYAIASPQALAVMNVLYQQFCEPLKEKTLC
jgi:DNA-binding transcriptional ArsR family regulator